MLKYSGGKTRRIVVFLRAFFTTINSYPHTTLQAKYSLNTNFTQLPFDCDNL